ncbi:MAG: hypothetical protein K2X27_05125 [Candidatus Obscuribacterales bacterium]|nr:hypothetical protein [Candidatus Obscuribacterales bacterium]
MSNKLLLKRGVTPLSKKERQLLSKLYIDKNMTAEDIASHCEVAVRTIYTRLKMHGLSKTMDSKALIKYCNHCGQKLP